MHERLVQLVTDSKSYFLGTNSAYCASKVNITIHDVANVKQIETILLKLSILQTLYSCPHSAKPL
jgi:hypothetical protein